MSPNMNWFQACVARQRKMPEFFQRYQRDPEKIYNRLASIANRLAFFLSFFDNFFSSSRKKLVNNENQTKQLFLIMPKTSTAHQIKRASKGVSVLRGSDILSGIFFFFRSNFLFVLFLFCKKSFLQS